MLSKREFHGEQFYIWVIQEYEAARVFLKKCGRPLTEYDRFLITEAKWTCSTFKTLID